MFGSYTTRSLEGRLVEVFGVSGLVEPEADSQGGRFDLRPAAIEANGLIGRAVWWIDGRDKYMVHLFDGMYVAIPEDNLKEHLLAAPEDGGFDLAWPSQSEAYPEFALSLGEMLREKGWCCVQMIATEEMRSAAVEQAMRHTKHKVLREEFVTDYLGQYGSGKTAFLETEVPDPDHLDRLRQDPLSTFDRSLTNASSVVASIAWDTLGFPFGDRTKGMLWQPFATKAEEDSLRPKPLNEEDIQEGAIADHIGFLQRRKLGLMVWLENSGGEITLLPRHDLPRDPITLPLTTKKLLVYRCDELTYEYRPFGHSLVLQSWILAEQPRTELQLANLQGDAEAKAEMMGIFVGRPHPQGDKVHIMSLHTRLPGGGSGGDAYWAMLAEGTDGMGMIPFLRWDTDLYCTKEDEPHVLGKCYARHGGFCSYEEIYAFDNKFFDISDFEAKWMSPSQRIVCEDGYTVLYKGGHSRASLDGAKIGVFLGDTGSDWTAYNGVEHQVMTAAGPVTTTSVPSTAVLGANQAVTCARLSHIMNMRGPVATADTACSSSLVATGAAMNWMRPREFDPKLKHLEARVLETVAGGVCVQIGPFSYIGMCALSMISPNGRCFTFDESGDGYARGEGVGLMYLKSSEDELDRINQCACLLSAQINQDGRSASMTAPNGPSQQACIQASMREAQNEARDINLAECHGTGTALGDPIEVGALRNAMEPRDTVLALTSSKSNIGHLEGGAGIAGLLKCIVMLNAGTCPPNAHCRQLNPHLSVGGFPCYFDTEAIDTMMNSALTGVSSFGFGGTNGRCDIWGQAKFGPQKSGQVNLEDLDQITVTCPISMAQIDHVTGEPMVRSTPSGVREKVKADVLREEFAPYDISRFVYEGGFRYRKTALPEEVEVELGEGEGVFVCGSWSGWSAMEEMQRQDDGWYLTTMVLGEGRYELFDLCLNRDPAMKIYPAVHRAHRKIWVQGPDDQSGGKKWLVDGRDSEVKAGTVFHIHFRWTTERMEVYWEPVSQLSGGLAIKYEHNYSLIGDFSKWKCVPLARLGDHDGAWEGTFRIGASGRAEFQLLRDADQRQAIYPSQHRAKPSAAPARGPDDMGKGRHFFVSGRPGDDVQVHLTVVDAAITVVATSSCFHGEWRSQQGWARHQYCVVGTLSDAKPVPMMMDPSTEGRFTCQVSVGHRQMEDAAGGWGDFFQVAVDGDILQAFYPEAGPAEVAGQIIVRQPDGAGSANRFLLRVAEPSTAINICLDLNAEDRRKTVTWSLAALPQLMDVR